MDRKDKIKNAVKVSFMQNQQVTTSEIIETVQSMYPEVPRGSILPSDFCVNHSNEDPFSGRYHIFHKVSQGCYKVL
ncbi:DUF7669 domain-containing protein [Vibrio parahaemolyticus]|uniref:DUF7669 domain-containing protein n=1 Tax=Vibrio parahaemolyticus TaxID=670 RepID=UPI0040378419